MQVQDTLPNKTIGHESNEIHVGSVGAVDNMPTMNWNQLNLWDGLTGN